MTGFAPGQGLTQVETVIKSAHIEATSQTRNRRCKHVYIPLINVLAEGVGITVPELLKRV